MRAGSENLELNKLHGRDMNMKNYHYPHISIEEQIKRYECRVRIVVVGAVGCRACGEHPRVRGAYHFSKLVTKTKFRTHEMPLFLILSPVPGVNRSLLRKHILYTYTRISAENYSRVLVKAKLLIAA